MTDEEKLLKIEELRAKFENGVVEWLNLGQSEFEIQIYLFGWDKDQRWINTSKHMTQAKEKDTGNMELKTPGTYGSFIIFK